MKFTDGYWQTLPGVSILHPKEVESVAIQDSQVAVFSATAALNRRGDTLNRPMISATFDSPAPGVIGVQLEHFQGTVDRGPHFQITRSDAPLSVAETSDTLQLTTGDLTAKISTQGPWHVEFLHADGSHLTSSLDRSVGVVATEAGENYVVEQLTLSVGELLYGLGERFGPLIKNGQSIDIWNEDGGTASDQAYKNVPLYLSNRGYGVFVDHPERVSYELATEVVSRAQFSVPGQRLRYYIIGGKDPLEVLRRYTALTGRPAQVPTWSYGPWLSTSFTTDYDEATVTSFIDGMAARELPLSVFHFDCFWMRQFHWCDFVWDPATFPDPEGMIKRLHQRGLKVCVWINPYIAQRSHLFAEGKAKGYLVQRENGDVWQWDMWQAGMALVDFTNPDARTWYQSKLKVLLDQGVDSFKTDFGERIPTDVRWHDGSDPQKMHNYYTHLFNEAVFELLEAEKGSGQAVLFARSATAGGQQFPVHWGGDCESTYVSMAESLRGGLSLAASGFGFWSHDIGGFEGLPDPGVFKRWTAFGLLSSHSRFHGSTSYRVPWLFDDEAVEVTRRFTHLKHQLMPYLAAAGLRAHRYGEPVMRPMVINYPTDRSAALADTQYLLGEDVLVAPIFSDSGEVEFYLPEGNWTHLLTGEVVAGGRWLTQQYDFFSLPIFIRPGAVIPWGAQTQRPDYEYSQGLTLRVFELADGASQEVSVTTASGDEIAASFQVQRLGKVYIAKSDSAAATFKLQVGEHCADAVNGVATLSQ